VSGCAFSVIRLSVRGYACVFQGDLAVIWVFARGYLCVCV